MNGKLCSISPASNLEFKSKLFAAVLIPLYPPSNMPRLPMGIYVKACGVWGSDWCSWQWGEKCPAGGHLAPDSTTNLFAMLARTPREAQGKWRLPSACAFLFWSLGDRLDVHSRKFVPFQTVPQKLHHLGVFEESFGILVLAIAKEPQFLDVWYKSSVLLHKPNSPPACQPLVSLVWHLWGFFVVFILRMLVSQWL